MLWHIDRDENVRVLCLQTQQCDEDRHGSGSGQIAPGCTTRGNCRRLSITFVSAWWCASVECVYRYVGSKVQRVESSVG
jgi:hypothetical protein